MNLRNVRYPPVPCLCGYRGSSGENERVWAHLTQIPKNNLLVKGKIDQNLWSPRVCFLTHSLIEGSGSKPHFNVGSKSSHTQEATKQGLVSRLFVEFTSKMKFGVPLQLKRSSPGQIPRESNTLLIVEHASARQIAGPFSTSLLGRRVTMIFQPHAHCQTPSQVTAAGFASASFSLPGKNLIAVDVDTNKRYPGCL